MMSLKLLFLTVIILSGFPYPADAIDTLIIRGTLDTRQNNIEGVMRYIMPSRPDLKSFEFQMYSNVYSSEDSPYMIKRMRLTENFQRTGRWGEIIIDSIFLDDQNILRDVRIEFTRGVYNSPDSQSLNNRTVTIYFTTYIPEMGEKLTFQGDEYLLGGWFPVPALLNERGEWYNPVYGRFTEATGEYFYYEIDLTIPNNFVVASPVSAMRTVIDDSLVNLHYTFGPASDFVFVLSPHLNIDSSFINETLLKIYFRSHEKPVVERIRTAVRNTFEYMTAHVGDYAYTDYSAVIFNTAIVGGIEFPALTVLLSPSGGVMATRFYESLVVHETVHQWFYAMIGSDQAAEPWMDEAIVTFFTQKIMAEYWGVEANLFDFAGLQFAERDYLRASFQLGMGRYAVSQRSDVFINYADYFSTIYFRGALAIETFDNLLGDSLSNIFWHKYFNRYLFGHPTKEDFINLTHETAGENIAKALMTLLNDPAEIDLSVRQLTNRKIDSTTYEARFILTSRGGLQLPIDCQLIKINGDTIEYQWAGKYNTEEVSILTGLPVKTVIIDPNNIIAVDINLLNNSTRLEPDSRAGMRLLSGIMFLIESTLSYLGGL